MNRDHLIKQRHSELTGWCQLAALAHNDGPTCQCADGNVMKFAKRAYAVKDILNTTEALQNVTADDVLYSLYEKINATLKLPGASPPIVKTLSGNEAYCLQICFSRHNPYDITVESLRDALLLDIKII